MNWQSEFQSTAERMIESTKVTAAASAFSTAAGLASLQQWITGIGSTLAVFAGLAGVLILARLNWIKIKNEQIKQRMLLEKASELGIDLEDE